MRAFVVSSFSQPPALADFADPVAGEGEVLVEGAFAAVSTLARAQASGRHYSSRNVPFVPGIDGVGTRTDDGSRVYFAFPRAPFGSMGKVVPVPRAYCVALPDDLDDATAAAAGNPGMSCYAALTIRARLQPGERVLVNGATGVSGRLAVQVAKHLGARHVLATGRNLETLEELRSLGADEVIALGGEPEHVAETLRRAVREHEPDVVLDYLWGEPAGWVIEAFAGRGTSQAERRVRFVQIGSSAGASLAVPAHAIRSSGLEILGSGLGSISYADLIAATSACLRDFTKAHYRVAAEIARADDAGTAWDRDVPAGSRLVLAL